MRLRFRRFLRLLNMLQSRIAYSVSDLAHELGVNKRTVYRDIRFLEEADIPIRYDPRKGGYVLQCHFDLRIPNVSHDELTAILLAAHIVSLSCVRTISHTLGQAINRLLAQTPLSFRESAANLLSSVRGTPSVTSWPHGSTGAIAEILSALSQKRQVRIVYDPPGEAATSVRTKVTPNYMMASGKRWYLVGRSSWHRRVERFDIRHVRFAEQVDASEEPTETASVNPLNNDLRMHPPLVA